MQSGWGACPPDVLQHCFNTQLDPNDNAAAACVNKLWRDTFRCAVQSVDVVFSALRDLPGASYVRQFTQVISVTLRRLPILQSQTTWLANPPQGHQSPTIAAWADTVGNVPSTCLTLTLDHCLPTTDASNHIDTLSQSISQLTNLRQLNLQDAYAAGVPIGALSEQTKLEVLQVSGRLPHDPFHLLGSLQALPSSITRLQLSACTVGVNSSLNIEDLAHLQTLQDLDLTDCKLRFGTASKSGGLSMLTRLLLNCNFAHVSLCDDILPLIALRVLTLRVAQRRFSSSGDTNVLFLGELLCHLSGLQQLDVIDCPAVLISPADCKHLKLRSFSFQYSQLDEPNESCFEHFLVDDTTSANISKPFLRMDGRFTVWGIQDWVSKLPFQALTHLTVHQAERWPDALFDLPESDLQHLRVLDIRFPHSCSSSSVPVKLKSKVNLTDLYIADSSHLIYDFAQCTSLASLSITHKVSVKPCISLPPFLTRLCLHNTLSASTDPRLHTLDHLIEVKLGGRVTSTDITRQLPSLPSSTVKLDLWDGLLTDLQQLTRLTNLKKLSLPDAPTEQQLQIIRQLRQMRWLDVTGRQGSFSCCIVPHTCTACITLAL